MIVQENPLKIFFPGKYEGIIAPAVTPLTLDYKLDEVAVQKMFSNFYQHNISPFILGTTGESASFTL